MQKKWKAFVKKVDVAAEGFGSVLESINGFLIKPFEAVIDGKQLQCYWSAEKFRWEEQK